MVDVFWSFYAQPMENVYTEAITLYIIWTVAICILNGRTRRIVAVIGFVASLILIFLFTVVGRTNGSKHELSLIPFISFEYAKTQPEFYRSIFMNILLFIPLGLTFPHILSKIIKFRGLLSLSIGFVLSILVETIQFFCSFGKCETDDVIMNTLGTLIGVTSYWLGLAMSALNDLFLQRSTRY